ncbi:MAG: type II toxin-antitoxin system PemK/MazF family toxin [Candidatus Moranbacteria bacterium]|nr:type II toxin-antitoxin system PemK/MazF family toxin [Candidatus Moranbacteria bacterium]
MNQKKNEGKYTKDFDRWNDKKKQTDSQSESRELFIYPREVWWCALGVNVGSEVDGKNENFERPVLLVKVISANGFFGIPLTSRQKGHRYEIIVNHDKGISFANTSQLRFLSKKRMLRKIGMASEDDFRQVLKRCQDLFQ